MANSGMSDGALRRREAQAGTGSPARASTSTRIRSIELRYTLDGEEEQRVPLSGALDVPLERAKPIRGLSFYRRQARNPGWYWSTTVGGHVPYESRLKLAHLLDADFDPTVVGIVAQPFSLHWREAGRSRRHVPDYLLVLRDGQRRIIDVASPERATQSATLRGHRVCRTAANRLGWSSGMRGAPDLAYLRNLRLLAGARRRHWAVPQYESAVLAAAGEPIAIANLEAEVGPQVLARPVVLHLIWHGQLLADLGRPLSRATIVRGAA
jgi:hypothetical protein